MTQDPMLRPDTLATRSDGVRLQDAIHRVRTHLQDRDRLALILVISGSHSCGLERPDSDIDVRGIYVDPCRKILGLRPGRDTCEGELSGDIDYQCYELKKFCGMLLSGNGNATRILLNPLRECNNPSFDWAGLGRQFLTKKLRRYYRGYAENQRSLAMKQNGGKALIYVYREMFEGLHVMAEGYPLFDFRALWAYVRKYGFYDGGLLNEYFGNPDKHPTDEAWRLFQLEWDRLAIRLDEQAISSPLPDDYDGFDELNELLLEWRAAW